MKCGCFSMAVVKFIFYILQTVLTWVWRERGGSGTFSGTFLWFFHDNVHFSLIVGLSSNITQSEKTFRNVIEMHFRWCTELDLRELLGSPREPWTSSRVALKSICLDPFVSQSSAGGGHKESKKVIRGRLKEACFWPTASSQGTGTLAILVFLLIRTNYLFWKLRGTVATQERELALNSSPGLCKVWFQGQRPTPLP